MLSKAFLVIASALALGLGRSAYAADAAAPWQGAGGPVIEAPPADAPGDDGLDHITVFRIDGWRPVGRDAIILWATAFQPYLLKLDRPAIDLPFVEHVGLTSDRQPALCALRFRHRARAALPHRVDPRDQPRGRPHAALGR
jgi:hypothetical protein